jgi:integrase
MASLQERKGSFRILFCWDGKLHGFTIGKVDRTEAESKTQQVEYLLMRLKQGLIHLPPGMPIVEFVESDGRVRSPAEVAKEEAPPPPTTFKTFKERYLEAHRHGAMEANSLATAAMHLGHFERTLGEGFQLQRLVLVDLQRHVNARARKKYRGKPLSPVTLRKETASFRAAWNWAILSGLMKGTFPSKGLVYPKADEKPPFMTLEEARTRAEAGGLSEGELAELWDSVYLRRAEVDELLQYVKAKAAQPWVYPLFCTAAHTGARRSELLRATLADVNLTAGILLVREKKRSRKQRTTRHVSLSPFLKEVLKDWLAVHPGGKYLFCQAGTVARSKKRSATTGHRGEKTRPTSLKARTAGVTKREAPPALPVTRDEAHDHFRRTLAGSKWEVLRGFHLFRHSFISCLAVAGVDQRIIDEFSGHTTDEQRRRYRHLIPDVKQDAVAKVFG